jgi:hypothetical protein
VELPGIEPGPLLYQSNEIGQTSDTGWDGVGRNRSLIRNNGSLRPGPSRAVPFRFAPFPRPNGSVRVLTFPMSQPASTRLAVQGKEAPALVLKPCLPRIGRWGLVVKRGAEQHLRVSAVRSRCGSGENELGDLAAALRQCAC